MGSRIYEAIPAIMADIDAVGKNKKNEQQKFMYRGIDDVMNAINPALVKHKVFVVPELLEQKREERTTSKGGLLIYSICKIKFSFCADDGSHVDAITVGEGMDSGDKATNKAMAIAFKYACFQVFCIPTEEMKNADPDRECHEVAPNQISTNELIDSVKVNALKSAIQNHNLTEQSVLDRYNLNSFEKMSFEQWNDAMKLIQKYYGEKNGSN